MLPPLKRVLEQKTAAGIVSVGHQLSVYLSLILKPMRNPLEFNRLKQ